MRKTILQILKKAGIICLLFGASFVSQAQTFNYGNNTNAVAVSGPTTSGSTTNYTFTIPFYEPNMTGVFSVAYNTIFSCGSGYYKHITLNKTNGTYVSSSDNSNGVSIPGTSMPLGTTSYVMRVYCANGAPDLPSQLLATKYINITVVKESDPSLSLSLSAFCKKNSDNLYNGYIGFNVTGSYVNASKLYLSVAGTCSQADTKLTILSNNSNLPTNSVLPNQSIYDCNANTTYTVSMVYRSTTITGQNLVYDIPNGSYGWTDYSWTKTFKSCLNKLEPVPSDPVELKNATVIYPNPVKDLATIKVSNDEKIISVSILDYSNKIQKRENYKKSSSEQSLEVGDLRKGIYLLEIVTDKGVKRERLVKE
ncbi:T9SS type A sorting domain-containing protein [Flavobacterium sp. H122]|uniref:T9SS type A sorting domain-containing protein n=1 Tax=Flavobacterium sp. H122 TaxID=2529860 RepID=UPI0010AA8E4C|nr:T9SS type A sorting domain-containing protein [Flavobacterium sp. H122]